MNNTEKVIEQSWQNVIKLNGVKSVNMHVTYFLNGSVFSFFVILFYIERK